MTIATSINGKPILFSITVDEPVINETVIMFEEASIFTDKWESYTLDELEPMIGKPFEEFEDTLIDLILERKKEKDFLNPLELFEPLQ